MNRLTKQEQTVLCIVLGLLLTGWATKTYRTAHSHPIAQDQRVAQTTTQSGGADK